MKTKILLSLVLAFAMLAVPANAQSGSTTRDNFYYDSATQAYANLQEATVTTSFMGMTMTDTAYSLLLSDGRGGHYFMSCTRVAQGANAHYYTPEGNYVCSTADNGATLVHSAGTMRSCSQSTYTNRPQNVQDVEKALLMRCVNDGLRGVRNNWYGYIGGNVYSGVYGGGNLVTPPASSGSSSYGSSSGGSSGSSSSSSKRVCHLCNGSGDCSMCRGSGKCSSCSGNGYVSNRYGGDPVLCSNCERSHNGLCSNCHGSGRCHRCSGAGWLE